MKKNAFGCVAQKAQTKNERTTTKIQHFAVKLCDDFDVAMPMHDNEIGKHENYP